MKKLIKKLLEDNFLIYVECGGLMYLIKSILLQNKKYKMIGLFDVEIKMIKKMRFNYIKGKIITKNPIFEKLHNF